MEDEVFVILPNEIRIKAGVPSGESSLSVTNTPMLNVPEPNTVEYKSRKREKTSVIVSPENFFDLWNQRTKALLFISVIFVVMSLFAFITINIFVHEQNETRDLKKGGIFIEQVKFPVVICSQRCPQLFGPLKSGCKIICDCCGALQLNEYTGETQHSLEEILIFFPSCRSFGPINKKMCSNLGYNITFLNSV